MEQQTHKRRVRYKGTHPRTYQEKYKELNPEKYKDTIEHVIQKSTVRTVKLIQSARRTAESI